MNSPTRQTSTALPESTVEMLPQNPPPQVVRWMAWLLISIFAATLLASILVRIPETVHCPFVLISESGADPIQSPLLGAVHQVKASEGQEVKEGAELFVLRSDEIRAWQTQIQGLQEDLRALHERSAKLEESFASQFIIKNAEIVQVEKELGFREKHTATSRDIIGRMEKLAADGLLSRVELLRYQLELAESEKDLHVTQKTLQQVTLQRKQLETERTRQRTDEESEMEKLKFRIEALKRQLANCEGDFLVVRAPYRAVVISLTQRNAGNVVQNGQELCQLARLEGDPRARLLIRDAGLPKLAAGQKVRLFFEAFPYQRYGTITARLDWISPAAVTSAEGRQFVARAVLDQTMFTARNQQHALRVGMKGEARIVVGSRTLIEYAFEPLRQLREQLRY